MGVSSTMPSLSHKASLELPIILYILDNIIYFKNISQVEPYKVITGVNNTHSIK